MQSLRVKYSLEIQRTGYRRGSAQAFHLSVPGSSLLSADKKTWQIWSKLEKGLPKPRPPSDQIRLWLPLMYVQPFKYDFQSILLTTISMI